MHIEGLELIGPADGLQKSPSRGGDSAGVRVGTSLPTVVNHCEFRCQSMDKSEKIEDRSVFTSARTSCIATT